MLTLLPYTGDPQSTITGTDGKVLSWQEVNPNIEPVVIPAEFNSSIKAFVAQTLGVTEDSITQDVFEDFLRKEAWATEIGGKLYPIEPSAVFDAEGKLVDARIGGTYPDLPAGVQGWTPGPEDYPGYKYTFTHYHPYPDTPQLTTGDLYIFTSRQWQQIRAVGSTQTFAIEIDPGSAEILKTLKLSPEDASRIEDSAQLYLRMAQEDLMSSEEYQSGVGSITKDVEATPKLYSSDAITQASELGYLNQDGRLPIKYKLTVEFNTPK